MLTTSETIYWATSYHISSHTIEENGAVSLAKIPSSTMERQIVVQYGFDQRLFKQV